MINAHTKLCGIIGNPIRHSISPAMHNAAITHLGLNYAYLAFDVSANLKETLDGLRALGIAGLNVTLPHKVSVLPLLDELDPQAQNIGAVNTIVNQRGKLKGYNTDADGFIEALNAAGFEAKDKRVLLLGAGGAARAIAFALAQQGAHVSIFSRAASLVQAKLLAQSLNRTAQHPLKALELSFVNLKKSITRADLLINATSVGMAPIGDRTPVPAELLRPSMVLFDAVYTPQETRLLREGRAKGCTVISGLEMLIQQGAQAFKLYTGHDAPISVMRRAAQEELHGNQANNTTKPVSPKTAVALIGFMGCGKSSVGRVLARQMGKPFVDIDQRIEKKAGKSIMRIFAEDGEVAFRALEKSTTRAISTSGKKVIACGGGVILDAQNISNLKRRAVVIYLKSSAAVIKQRLTAAPDCRPLLTGEKWLDNMRKLLAKRAPLYIQAADITIENSKTDVATTAKIIMQKLGEYESFNF